MTRKQATIAVRSGLNDDEQYGCVVPPIHLSSTYNFTGFNEPRAHDYSRRGNPTRDVTQRALAELEGGAGALAVATGAAAIMPTAEASAPALRKLRRDILLSFITRNLSFPEPTPALCSNSLTWDAFILSPRPPPRNHARAKLW